MEDRYLGKPHIDARGSDLIRQYGLHALRQVRGLLLIIGVNDSDHEVRSLAVIFLHVHIKDFGI